MATQEKTWNVANRLHSQKDSDNPEVNHIIAGADEIYDDAKGAKQSDINAQTDASLADRYTKEETYSKEQLDDLITTPDVTHVSVVATNATTAVTDILPATGEANTIYRVGNWNGTQYDPAMYALYAWNGTTYVCLAVRSFVGEVYDISVNHPDGQGNPTPYADLTAALGTNGANIPADIRRGGMSIQFIKGNAQSSDNKYVQYRLMLSTFTATQFTNTANWQGVDENPTANSNNLVKSGGVEKELPTFVLTGAGNTIISSSYYDKIKVGNTYRLWVKNPDVSTAGITYTQSAYTRFSFSARDSSNAKISGAIIELGCDTLSSPLSDYYDLTLPTGTASILVTCRCAVGEQLVCMLQDITEMKPMEAKLIKLTGFGTTGNAAGATNLGDIFYNTSTKLLRKKIGSNSFETVPYYDGAIYTCHNLLYIYNGSELISVSNFDYYHPQLIQGCGVNMNNGGVTHGSTSAVDYTLIKEGVGIYVKGTLGTLVTPLALYDENKVFIEAEVKNSECFRSADYLNLVGAKYFKCTISASQITSGDWYVVQGDNIVKPIDSLTREIESLQNNTNPFDAARYSSIRLCNSIGNPLRPITYTTDENGYEIPTTKEESFVQKKAAQFADITWTPASDVPDNAGGVFSAGVAVKGLPYSSVKELDKYVGWDVSLHTFMTAVNNPYSLLYTENVSAANSSSAWGKTYHGLNCSAYFGTVCNEYALFAAGCEVDYETTFDKWLYEYKFTFAKVFNQSAQGVRIGDIWWQSGHNRIITGVKRNEDGDVTNVIVSEAVNIKVIVTEMTASAFDALIASQHATIYRSIELYMNRYTPSPYIPLGDEDATSVTYNDDICTFAGDRATFREGDTIVIDYNLKSVGTWTDMEIYKNGSLLETISIDNSAHYVNLTDSNLSYGSYKARMKTGSTYSDYTYWEIVKTNVSHSHLGSKSVISFSSSNGKPIYYILCTESGNRTVMNSFTNDEIANGVVVVDFNELYKQQRYASTNLSGTYFIKVKFRGDYGCVTNTPIQITL